MSDEKPPLLIRWIINTDVWILVRVFLRFTWWMDRRWHINQYRLAATVGVEGHLFDHPAVQLQGPTDGRDSSSRVNIDDHPAGRGRGRR